jgi:AraC-like DNA-binding protein
MPAVLPPKEPVTPEASPSLLEQLIRQVENDTPLRVSFEDLSGVSYDVPDLRLPNELRIHSCEFCLFAKAGRASHQGCRLNKHAVNRLAVRRGAGFSGLCHLGLTDIVEPLLYHGQVLGMFYCGSVVVKGTEKQARSRIERYCHRHDFDPKPYLARLESVPRVPAATITEYSVRLRLITALAAKLVAAHAPWPQRYRTYTAADSTHVHRFPPLVQRALRYVHRHSSQPLQVQQIALAIKCHPNYLSRVFRRAMGCSLGEYILHVRVDRARHLLQNSHYSLDEIAYRTGFHDQSHFARVFKKYLGAPPGAYRAWDENAEANLAEEIPMLRDLSYYQWLR